MLKGKWTIENIVQNIINKYNIQEEIHLLVKKEKLY